jgi:integral membrane protein
MKKDATMKNFRLVAYLEGISLLILFLIAMPLKYVYGMPMAVRLVGWVHGLLFIGYVAMLGSVRVEYGWSFRKTSLAFLAAVLPFGVFVFDRSLRDDLKR